MKPLRLILPMVLLLAPWSSFGALNKAEIEEGWIQLFDGQNVAQSSSGWAPSAGSGWVTDNGVLATEGTPGMLHHQMPFADFLLRFDVKMSASSAAAGLYVRANREGNPNETGYRVPLGASDSEWPFGSIVGQAKGTGAFPNGAWIPVEIEANGTSLVVRSGNRVVSSATIQGGLGLLELDSGRGGRVDIRNMRVKQLNPQSMFNGSDLSGWKSTGTQPKQGGNKITKMFGGGKGKPREVKWTVAGGLIHGVDGPGQLESIAPFGDFIFQADVRINSKKSDSKRPYGLLIRADAGQLGSGYEINLQPGIMGGLNSLAPAKKQMGSVNEFATVTVTAFNRHFNVWVDGTLISDFDDVRPEGTNPTKDARITPGAIAFLCGEDNSDIDIKNIKVIQLAKVLGHVPVKKQTTQAQPQAPAAPVAPPPVAVAPSPSNAANDAQLKALQDELKQEKLDKANEDKKKATIGKMMQQALKSDDPKEQVNIYDTILAEDPDNQVAFGARKDAQAKVDAKAAADADVAQKAAAQQAETVKQKEAFEGNLQLAQAAFLTGNLSSADSALSLAEKANPGDDRVKNLRQRLDAARSRTSSMLYVAGAGAGVAILGALAWMFTAGRKKDPYFEIVDGLDKGKKFNIDQEVLHVGAVTGDGGAKNEVVLRDMERLISRFHAEIIWKDGKIYVVDTNSANGTFVDKKRIPTSKPQMLKKGSKVSFGGTTTIKIGFEKRAKDSGKNA